MVTKEELQRVNAFVDLPDDVLDWFLANSKERTFAEGEVYWRPGEPINRMIVILKGQVEARGDIGGELMSIVFSTGQVTGILPFSRLKESSVTGRALVETHVLEFPSTLFPELTQRSPLLTQRLVGIMSDRIREFTRMEQQRDRLAGLGKLSAGLAHELNNPASAATRAASQLREMLYRVRNVSHELARRELTQDQKCEIENLENTLMSMELPTPDPLTMSALEDEIDCILRSHGHDELWQMAGDLARRCVKPEVIEGLYGSLGPDTAKAALMRIALLTQVADLLREIESATGRISELVRAMKDYTYMDQTPVQNVDIVKSLETTLTILNHKLKKGVTVTRDYQKLPLAVNSFGSELNQVWTNLIDNAISAMAGKGELRVKTYKDGDCVNIEITDNGSGIPKENLSRIFEPFFTTKAVGEGTGLGLDTVQRIVRKHRGNITVTSRPRETKFTVSLPLTGTEQAQAVAQSATPAQATNPATTPN
jgi:signal transduction histidine kinase